jgi:hypothetical protein
LSLCKIHFSTRLSLPVGYLLPSERLKPKRERTNFGCRFGSERLVEFQHGELGRVEDLVTKLAITFHAQDFEVDITPYDLPSAIAPSKS